MSLQQKIQQELELSAPKIEDEIIPINEASLLNEFRNGKPRASPAHVGLKNEIGEDVFAWKKGFLNCFTGYPNDGKTDIFNQLSLIKAIKDGWKMAVWSPEMYGSDKIDGRIVLNANDLVDELIWKLYGVCPIRDLSNKYGSRILDERRYKEGIQFVKNHYTFVKPKDRTIHGILDTYKRLYDKQPYDILLIDPFKNITQSGDRLDRFMEETFAECSQLAKEMDVVFNFIAHPKANVVNVDKSGNRIPCDQYALSGGAAWNNSMDGIYSQFRPDRSSPMAKFYNFKQRKQHLVAQIGVCENIRKDYTTNRFIINNIDPFDNKEVQLEMKPYTLPSNGNEISNFEKAPF